VTELFVVSGAGGVGKTTSSTALALAFARRQLKTLLVTVDPARRLADVVEQPLEDTIVTHDTEPMLSLWMPSTSAELSRISQETMTPEDYRAFEANRVTKLFHVAPAGLHEAACALSLGQVASDYDVVVVDTAPFEHSRSFVQSPARLRRLLEGNALTLFAAFGSGRGFGQRIIERMLDRVMPAEVIAEGADFFRSILKVRHELARRAAQVEALLTDARHVVVAAPTEVGVQCAQLLRRRLEPGALKNHGSGSYRKTTLTILNRAVVDASTGVAADETAQALRRLSGAYKLPVLEGSSREIVYQLSSQLADIAEQLVSPTTRVSAAV
jgi:anion-transporting  ArsA/GET3 family ATPase